MQIRQEKGCYTLYKENEAIGTADVDGTTILRLEVVPRTAASWCAAACPTCPPCSSAMRF